jgi:hypothetical protein
MTDIERANVVEEALANEIEIRITTATTPPGKVADAEIIFLRGPLTGLKLIGFGVWERRSGGGLNVTFPARQYAVNGERRSFALLRPVADNSAQDTIRDRIIKAYQNSIA